MVDHVNPKMAVFCVAAPCNLAEVYQHQGDESLPDDGGSKDLINSPL